MNRTVPVWVVNVCALQSVEPALAADAHRSVAATLVMHVYVAGTPAAVTRTSATVHELCSRLGVDVVVEPAADESALDDATATAWIKAFVDLRSSATPRVVVVDADTHREIERRSLPTSASLEMTAEEAAHVLYVAAESALSAREARTDASAVERHGAPAPSSPPEGAERPQPVERRDERTVGAHDADRSARAPERDESTRVEGRRRGAARRFQSDLRAFFGVATFGSSHASFGLGGSIDGGVELGRFRLSAAVSGSAYFPSEIARSGFAASLAAESGRAVLVGAWEATVAFVPFVALGGGLDWITVDANAPPPGAASAGAESRVDPILEAELGAAIRTSRRIGAFFAFATDVDFAQHRYVVEGGGAPQTVVALSRVRPAAFVGLSLLMGGGEPRQEASR